MTRLVSHPLLWIAATLAAISGVALGLGTPIGLVTEIAIYTLYAGSVNLLVAYSGLVPFGASVFFGAGSYAAALFALRVYGSVLPALAFTIVFCGLLAAMLGAIILRRRGLYFSLLTLAATQLAFEVAYRWTDLTGGENGLQDVPRPLFNSALSFHVLTAIVVLVSLGLIWRLAHSRFGRVLQAVRDNEQRTSSLGYNTYAIRLTAFTIAGAFIGLAGGLLAFHLQGAYANNLNWEHAGDALLMTVLGGVHHFMGPLWGSIVFIVLQDYLSAVTENWWLLFAPIIMVSALLASEGLQGFVLKLFKRDRWTLVRNEIPLRPEKITPFAAHDLKMDADQPILEIEGLSRRFGSLVVANDISLKVFPFQLHSFIGPNGAGKTTFFNMLSGVLPPNAGKIVFLGQDVTALSVHKRARLGLSRSYQIVSTYPNLTAFENVRLAVQARNPTALGFWRDAYTFGEINERAWSILDAVGLLDRATVLCANLAHGERRLLDIGMTLATDAKLLLLDEPLAGLTESDREPIGKLIRRLASTHAVVLIEHDIDRVVSLSDRITVLHQGRLIADGAPSEVVVNPDVIAAYLGKAANEERLPTALAPADAPRRAEKLLEVSGISAGYAGSNVLDHLSFSVNQGEAVALLGRNGAGKTTTLKTIAGVVRLRHGELSFDGRSLAKMPIHEINRLGVASVPEGRRVFPNLTVVENLKLAMRPGGASIQDAFAWFPRLEKRQNARGEALSGGERQMVAIARALMAPTKLLLLDEPFEGLAPAVVAEVQEAIVKLRGKVAMILVEHHPEAVLPIVDRAYVMINGRIAYEGSAQDLHADHDLQARLLGVADGSEATPQRRVKAVPG